MSEQDNDRLTSAIESILLVAGGPVSTGALASATGETRSRVEACLHDLSSRLTGGIRLLSHDGSVQLVSAPENAAAVQRFLGTTKPPPLSRSALETLSVIAYHQPVTRAEIESMRGTNSDRAVQTLVSRELVEERGRRAVIGRPIEYGTTMAFLEYFGLSSLDDLPALESLNERGAEPNMLGFRAQTK